MTTTRQRRCVATVVAIVVSIAPAILAAAASSTLDAPVATTGLQAATRIPVSCGGIDPVLLGYDGFYRRHCSALGIDVLASDAVDPAAVRRTAEIIVAMIGHRPDPTPICYPVSEVAAKYGASVEKETPDPREAYGDLQREPVEPIWPLYGVD